MFPVHDTCSQDVGLVVCVGSTAMPGSPRQGWETQEQRESGSTATSRVTKQPCLRSMLMAVDTDRGERSELTACLVPCQPFSPHRPCRQSTETAPPRTTGPDPRRRHQAGPGGRPPPPVRALGQRDLCFPVLCRNSPPPTRRTRRQRKALKRGQNNRPRSAAPLKRNDI